jgi:hypothetical protein
MENDFSINVDAWRCEERCSLDFVQCVEEKDGASICKTRERNCFNECEI